MSEHPYTFSFTVEDLPPSTFLVHSFTGREGISELYHYDILLVATDNDISYDKILQKSCVLTVVGRKHTLKVNGIVASLKFKQFESGKVLYQAILVPQLFNLTLQQNNQIFLDKSFPDILKSMLSAHNISSYELRLESSYPSLEYVCQFNESPFQFLSRWMEHYGIYYYFTQEETGEKIIFTDAAISHVAFDNSDLIYRPASGLDDIDRENVVKNALAEYSSVPQSVLLKDYSYQYSTMDMKGQAIVDEKGVGTFYSYGDNFKSPSESSPIARIRAQEFQCRQVQIHGESLCLGMISGFSYTLQDHFSEGMNGSYLLTHIQHTARNWTASTPAAANHAETQTKAMVYSNTFVAIPMSQQFRPERKTKKPRFYGLLTATIDAEGSGKYAELDSHGRYKVIMPFDLSGRSDGKASSWIRLMQPYAGGSYGMHFPLHKGTEVLISFVEGDVDRPLITGAVHNFNKPNHVATSNQDINSIITAGGHQIAIGDTDGNGFIHLQLAGKHAGLALLETGGGSGDSGDGGDGDSDGGDGDGGEGGDGGDSEEGGAKFLSYSNEYYEGTFGTKTEMTLGSITEVEIGVKNELFGGGKGDICGGMSWGLTVGTALEYFKGNKIAAGDEEFACTDEVTKLVKEEYKIFVGPPEAYSGLVSKLKLVLAGVAAASIATATANVTAMAIQYHGKEVPKDGYKSAASIIGDVADGADLLFDAAMMLVVRATSKALEEMSKASLVASSLVLSEEHGIAMKVNNLLAPDAKFVIENPAIMTKATFTMERGNSITLNSGSSMIGSVLLQAGPSASAAKVKVSGESIKLSIGATSSPTLLMQETMAKFSVGKGNLAAGISMVEEDSYLALAGGPSKVDMSMSMININTPMLKITSKTDTKINAAAFQVSSSAAVMINGTIIKLG